MSSDELIALAKARAEFAGVSPSLACSVCEQESSWNPWAIRYEPAFFARYIESMTRLSPTEARLRAMSFGLMQIMGETAREEGYVGDLTALCEPQTGLDRGLIHLKRVLARAAGNEEIALNLWNGGSNPQYALEVTARIAKYS